jgi:hypothetical protein
MAEVGRQPWKLGVHVHAFERPCRQPVYRERMTQLIGPGAGTAPRRLEGRQGFM